MKTILHILLAFSLFLATAGHAQNNWTLKSPTTHPPGLAAHALAYIGDDKVLVFGGVDGSYNIINETWVYDLSENNWTQMNPSQPPPPRYSHAMAYIGGDQVLVFGGSGTFDEYGEDFQLDDTWVYDLSSNTWTEKIQTPKPSARLEHAMANIGGDKVLLFSGWSASFIDDTWVYDLSSNTWTLQDPVTQPSARRAHAMANIGGDQVLIFGGWNEETWIYDLSNDNWIQKTPGSNPSLRGYSAMASLGGDQILIFGGHIGSAIVDDTWGFDLTDNIWTSKTPTLKPSARMQHAMACIGNNKVLLFGGIGNAFFDDTWVYTAEQSLPYCVPNEKVYICHNNNTICVDLNAMDVHLNHGDQIGECPLSKRADVASEIPVQYRLEQNYPNPFSASGGRTTSIAYAIPEDGAVQLRVFDSYGRVVSELENGMKSAGSYNVVFDARSLPSGLYAYRLEVNGHVLTGTMTLIK